MSASSAWVLAHGSGADEAAFVLAPLVVLGAISLANRVKQRRAGGRKPKSRRGPTPPPGP